MTTRPEGMRHSKQITYNTAGTIVSLFCQWLIMMLIPRITNFSDAGVFAVALSICSILNIFATFLIETYQISDQYRNYNENDYRVTRLVTIGFSFILCFAVLIISNYSWEQCLVIIAYMLYRNLLHYAYTYNATLQINERLDYVGKCWMAEGIVSLISFTASYYLTHDLVLSVIVMALLGGGTFLISVMSGYKRIIGRSVAVRRDTSAVRSLMKVGVPLLISGVAPIIITALPKLILQAVDGDEITGIFSTLSAPTIVIPTLITGIFAPFIVYFSNISRGGDMHLLRKQYSKLALGILGFGLICYLVSRLFGGYFLELLYGPDIVPYVDYFAVLIAGITLYSIGMIGITVLITKEQGRPAAIASVLSLAVSVLLFALVIPEYGIAGATYGLMASYGVFGLIISLFVLMVPLKERIRPEPAA